MIRRRFAVGAAAVFVAAFATVLSAQIALMSVLDVGRAEAVVDEVAGSALVTGLIDDAVRSAVTPVAGPAIANEVAALASSDARVRAVVTTSLLDGHRQLVDPTAPAPTGAADVDAVVSMVVADLSQLTGVDLGPAAAEVQVPGTGPG